MKKKLLKYGFLIVILYLIIFIIMFLFNINKSNYTNKLPAFSNIDKTSRTIEEDTDHYSINVSYPRYNNVNVNKVITNYIYNYISDFKKNCNNKEKCILNINYDIYDISNYSNIFFNISSSINEYDKYHSILIDNKQNKKASIDNLFSNIKEKINEELNNKYPSFVSNININESLDNNAYLITNDYINVYFKHKEYEKPISYDVNVSIYFTENKRNYEIDKNKKIVALTFDDGPSVYSKSIMNALLSNDSKATFFVLGSRLESYKDTLLYAYNNNFLIGSHTYNHKNLIKLSDNEIENELNSTNIIYNKITNSNITLLRPPYGNYNDNVKRLSTMPLILWSIDTNDWYYRDAEIVYNNILECNDGDIVLMHDLYPETLEAVKRAIPELKARGYELVTVNELANIKGITLEKGNAYRFLR